MKKSIYILALILGLTYYSNAQQWYNQKIEHTKGTDVVCPGSFIDNPSFVDIDPEIKAKLFGKNARPSEVQKATFVVNYVGFPDNAKAAFQRAVDIWAATLSSTTPIVVTARWESLGTGVLGAANANDFLRNFPGAKLTNTFYPLALAEKLAGRSLNATNEDDIYCSFNKDIPWYFGTADAVPLGTFDFTSIVLHELGHGLGMVSSMRSSGNVGSYGFGTTTPSIYDKYLENGEKKNLSDTLNFKNPSNALRNALVSEDIFFVSPKTDAANKVDKVSIYAPNPYQSGSSISHLDDVKYRSAKTNALMTPFAGLREKNLNPGPIVLNMFTDMGWKGSSIVHERIKNISVAKLLKVSAKILSDTTLVANSAKLVYTLNGGGASKAVSVPITLNAADGMYSANVDLPSTTTSMEYYLEVKDNFGVTITAPSNAGFTNTNFIYGFFVGKKDVAGPVIEHYAPEILPSTSPVSLVVNVEDDFNDGIDTTYVEYTVNGAARPAFGLRKYNPAKDNIIFSQGRRDDFAYFKENAITGLKSGDKVKYQVISLDKAKNKTIIPTIYTGLDQKDLPTLDFYEFTVTDIKNTVANDYSTDFETNVDDFATLGFSVTQPADFTNKALHSSHPYTNGHGLLDPVSGFPYLQFEKSEIAMLRTPIKLKTTDAIITFDQVVLVEPGETSSTYGSSSFYDYVVVEGSLDGNFWFPLQNGYDSRIDNSFKTLYDGNFSAGNAGNSLAKGNQALYKKQTINIYGTDFTSDFAGSSLLVRFRLYADQWTAGWGWAIDNLYIQKTPPVILANENIRRSELLVFPNPTSDILKLNLIISKPQTVKVEVYGLRGDLRSTEYVPVLEYSLNHEIELKGFATGSYLVKVTESAGEVVKRFNVLR